MVTEEVERNTGCSRSLGKARGGPRKGFGPTLEGEGRCFQIRLLMKAWHSEVGVDSQKEEKS